MFAVYCSHILTCADIIFQEALALRNRD